MAEARELDGKHEVDGELGAVVGLRLPNRERQDSAQLGEAV
jgi:hypothetical protein